MKRMKESIARLNVQIATLIALNAVLIWALIKIMYTVLKFLKAFIPKL